MFSELLDIIDRKDKCFGGKEGLFSWHLTFTCMRRKFLEVIVLCQFQDNYFSVNFQSLLMSLRKDLTDFVKKKILLFPVMKI